MNPIPRALVALPICALTLLAGPARSDEPAPAPPPAGSEEAPSNEELARRIEVLSRELEARRLGDAADPAPLAGSTGKWGLGPAASKVYSKSSGLSIGGYGESLYQNFDATREDGARSGKTNEWDYLRAVVYLGWKFDKTFVLNSEIEYEHASTGKGGEVSVEFLTLDAMLRDELNLRAGLLLAPVGLVNEMHEPTTSLGARRPDTESRILPSTWRANGVGVFGEAGPVAYKLYLTESLSAASFNAANGIRGGRQNGARATADNLAVTGRVDLVSVPGLLAGVSFFSGESGKDLVADGESFGARTTTFDVHADWRFRGLWLRGVFARVSIDDAALLNRSLGLTGARSIGERQEGYYLSAGYEILSRLAPGTQMALTPFVRWEKTDTQKEVPAGWTRDGANERKAWTVGLDFKPIPQLALKVDWQDYEDAAGTGVPQWNVALAYLF
ncbi:MAG TPA: hypothetical protein PLP50_04255 [Thermoanaerobaculia bacterium]|jgi:hypothetical protein|nr:hypothetical protein [Thermoanaerobaculia bacterium]HPA50794.1 hypothetical protein [Thermoanaerobaculia bacterium]HQN06218.1 hypothetical protein [Thermoanaerobaculia bacterium]HQP85543.1 hypothetical protein [Thermoanaerobaculia bacterium]